jgi:hypothetical protein
MWESKKPTLINRLFKNYKAWMAEHVVKPLEADARAAVHISYFPGDLSAVITKDGFRLGLVGLNSAWLQSGGPAIAPKTDQIIRPSPWAHLGATPQHSVDASRP